jgi:hypothetical protein
MRGLRIAILGAIGGLVCGCGGAAKPQRWTGGITLAASGSWSYQPSGGGSVAGNEAFSAHCTNNGDGVGEFTASFTLHNVETNTSNQTATTDATGTTDQATTADNTGCGLGASGDNGNWGVDFTLLGFKVTGQTVAGGMSFPINDDWTSEDFALVGSSAQGQFFEPQSGASGAVVGMYSFHSGDIVGGAPSMVITTNGIPSAIPVTVSWSYAPLN